MEKSGFLVFFHNFLFRVFCVFSVILVPELFRKVRETPGKKSHQVSYKSEVLGLSYDQKTENKFLYFLFSLYFFLLFWSRSCLERSGRLLGKKSTKFRPNPRSWDRVMTKKRFIQWFLRIFFNFLLEFSFSLFLVFWSFSRALGCLERSGKVLGFISTKFRPNLTPGDRVMTKKQK